MLYCGSYWRAVQNILVDHHCQCRDIFLCPHDGDTGYGVFISDFDSALQVDRGREKLERSKRHGQPIAYSVHGTPGYCSPEVSEGRVLNISQDAIYVNTISVSNLLGLLLNAIYFLCHRLILLFVLSQCVRAFASLWNSEYACVCMYASQEDQQIADATPYSNNY